MVHTGAEAVLVLQPEGHIAKRYQVEQFRRMVRRYGLDR